jgi:transcription elongation factor Elf1
MAELIASGYEWTCPKCETLNNVCAIPMGEFGVGAVECEKCKTKFKVTDINHAYGC